jgi:hypothetical protein
MKVLYFSFSVLLTALISFSCVDLITEKEDLNAKPDPQNIQILYKHDFRNEMNTFTQKLTKDLAMDGTITIDFWLTESEQNRIIDMAQQVDFFSLPDSMFCTKADSLRPELHPDPGIQQLKIRYNNKEKTVYWSVANNYPNEYTRLSKLTSLIKDIISAKKEYQDLPAARGGYL